MDSFTRKNYQKFSNIFVVLAILCYIILFAGILLFPFASYWAIIIPGSLGAVLSITARKLTDISNDHKKAYDH